MTIQEIRDLLDVLDKSGSELSLLLTISEKNFDKKILENYNLVIQTSAWNDVEYVVSSVKGCK